jgi:hypothetical protein
VFIEGNGQSDGNHVASRIMRGTVHGSPDRRLIEPGAYMVNEMLRGNFERHAWAAASHALPARARANVTVLDIFCLTFVSVSVTIQKSRS